VYGDGAESELLTFDRERILRSRSPTQTGGPPARMKGSRLSGRWGEGPSPLPFPTRRRSLLLLIRLAERPARRAILLEFPPDGVARAWRPAVSLGGVPERRYRVTRFQTRLPHEGEAGVVLSAQALTLGVGRCLGEGPARTSRTWGKRMKEGSPLSS
jgi:hypothetical protein